ncbi:MAG TPA: hypothetical protein VFQ07_03450 [Candidatus Polarisedimenticolia bacterium]|nr:hypothetical protein [Candidatus Polarisedimenticolia bacterium]
MAFHPVGRTSSIRRAFLAATLLTSLAPLAAWCAEAPPPQPKPEPGKALVYFARSGRMSGAAGSIYVFADRSFVGVLPNGSYGYAQLDPGHRLFWTTWTKATREIDLVPGETYYLEVWRDISVVDPAAGRALCEKVKDLSVPDAADREKAEKYISKKHDDALEKEGRRDKVAVEAAATPAAAPKNLEGMVKIPAYTQGVLELLETVTSEFTPAGTPVSFRLAEDLIVDGQTIAHAGRIVKGIVRESSQAGGYGKAGLMEIVVPTLTTEAGAVVPLVAQATGSGKDNDNGAVAAGLAGGLAGGFAVRGREAFHLAGDRLKVWTREDAWAPRRPPEASAAAQPESGPAAPALAFTARASDVVRFKPSKGYQPDDVVLVLETQDSLADLSITSVEDFALPLSLAAKKKVHREDGWHCAFDGWGVVRYLRAGRQAPQQVGLTGRLVDGRVFTAVAPVQYEVVP